MVRPHEYQLDFSKTSTAMEGPEGRGRKARKALAILEDSLHDLSRLAILDIGCSTGFMTRIYAEHFRSVIGMDIDAPAVRYAAVHNGLPNVRYVIGDSMRM